MSRPRVFLQQRQVTTKFGPLVLVSFTPWVPVPASVLIEYAVGPQLCELIGRKPYNFYKTLDILRIERIAAKSFQVSKLRRAKLIGSTVTQVSLIRADDALKLLDRLPHLSRTKNNDTIDHDDADEIVQVTTYRLMRSVHVPPESKPVPLYPESDPLSLRSFPPYDWTDDQYACFPSGLPVFSGHSLPPVRAVLPPHCWNTFQPLVVATPSRRIFHPDFTWPDGTE